MQCDPETMDWDEWPPFISPLGCMGWLFSIPGPMGPRLGAELELCCGGCPTSWLTEGSLLIPPPWALFIGERTGP